MAEATSITPMSCPLSPANSTGFPFWTEICVPPLSCVYFTYDKLLPKPAGKREWGTLAASVRRRKGAKNDKRA